MDIFLKLIRAVCTAAIKAGWLLFGISALNYALTGKLPLFFDFKLYSLAYMFGFLKALDEE